MGRMTGKENVIIPKRWNKMIHLLIERWKPLLRLSLLTATTIQIILLILRSIGTKTLDDESIRL